MKVPKEYSRIQEEETEELERVDEQHSVSKEDSVLKNIADKTKGVIGDISKKRKEKSINSDEADSDDANVEQRKSSRFFDFAKIIIKALFALISKYKGAVISALLIIVIIPVFFMLIQRFDNNANSPSGDASGDNAPNSPFEYIYNINLGGYELASYSGDETRVVIPRQFEGVNVVSIAGGAFRNCSLLYAVEIPDTVTEIGAYAFEGCANLTDLVIWEGLVTIGNCAFNNCMSLRTVSIPDSVTRICEEAFARCRILTNLVIGNGVEIIEKSAFGYCDSLEGIIYEGTSDEWEEIEKDSLWSDSSVIEYISCSDTTVYISRNEEQPPAEYVVPEGLEYSYSDPEGGYVITSYNGDESEVVIPPQIDGINVLRIKEGAFSYCKSLQYVVIPGIVYEIGEAAFWECTNLNEIVIEEGVLKIGRSVFSGCSSLHTVDIPDTVTEIGDYAFNGCTRLTQLTLGKGLEIIRQRPFANCSLLKHVFFTGTSEEWKRIGKNTLWNSNSRIECIVCSDTTLYLSDSQTSEP